MITNPNRLFRAHLTIVLAGTVLSLLPTAAICYSCFGASPLTILLLIPALAAGTVCDGVCLRVLYRPLRSIGNLSGEERYAQNPELSKAVVLLSNMSVTSLVRVAICRVLPSSVVYAVSLPALTELTIPPAAIISFMLLMVSLVPIIPAVYEMHALVPIIQEECAELLSYRTTLLQEWKKKIRVVGFAARLIVLVIMLGVVPVVALSLPGGVQPVGSLIVPVVSVTLAAASGILLTRDSRRSREDLLNAMHHLEKNRPGPVVSIPSGDEFAELGDGMARMIAGLKEQSFMRETFGKHIPKAVVEAVLRNGVKLTGEHRTVALVLVGIHQFDTRVEQSPPREIIALLNQYLATVIGAAQHFSGTIDKIQADRVLVIFGAPVTLDAPVERAILAALEIRKGIAKLMKRHTLPEPLRVAANIHYGRVVAGHIGASERWEYSVFGDAVNSVFQMNELSGGHHADIVLSDAAKREAGGDFLFGERLAAAETVNGSIDIYPLLNYQAGSRETRETQGS